MFQLEFVGFTRVGIDPRSTLTQSIARYQTLRDSGAPSGGNRFSNYD
jgi:LPS-assembly protein